MDFLFIEFEKIKKGDLVYIYSLIDDGEAVDKTVSSETVTDVTEVYFCAGGHWFCKHVGLCFCDNITRIAKRELIEFDSFNDVIGV